jgi:hypothetical protein
MDWGPNGETIIDYSVYDAIKAGFNKLVFVIRPHFEQEFKESVSSKYATLVEVHHVYQEVDTPIEGVESFPEREKPMGYRTRGSSVSGCYQGTFCRD